MFTKLYLQTTDPTLDMSQLFEPRIFYPMMVSVIFHTILYTLFFNMASYIFTRKSLSYQTNQRMVLYLLFIMFFGFFARFYHVKEIYKSYNDDLKKTREHLDKLYISWIFIS